MPCCCHLTQHRDAEDPGHGDFGALVPSGGGRRSCATRACRPSAGATVDAYTSGRDWALVADCNGIPATTVTCTARKIVERGTPDVKTRGGACTACTTVSARLRWRRRYMYSVVETNIPKLIDCL
ncbi:uncharacterized protein PITG_02152 [Phytophthora infestans T30-4]|uniref:Uncharacterized protein n=1 Tax=Phytophthora infestans (strain T30-4) TaxID=403677 RepID=D0MVL9_PHYIT|nr:uncharacterized protein PITG_02152 [Phytophthora infestans T30-4]EEY63682.1 hypothetical protein PITG_02152 [Phytophthora infestans T30-4]|eukprot:XP_002907118.1 hypothetical protein PITG_02152 [Phytophthora infestans T30-4]